MNVNFYWWGFRVTADASTTEQLLNLVPQGQAALTNFLNQSGIGWISSLVTGLINAGVAAIRAMNANCGNRGVAFTASWAQWNAYLACP